jgi:hypothetical protein
MKRPKQNFILDITSFIAFVLLAATGVLMAFVLPPGRGHGAAIWGLTRHEWGDIHLWIAIGLVALMILHLALHWTWIVCMIKGKAKGDRQVRSRVTLAWVGLVALLVLAVAPSVSSREEARETGQERRGQMQQESVRQQDGLYEHDASAPVNEPITNETITLGTIEYVTGVPVAYLAEALGLPGHVSSSESLQQLQQRHHVTIEDVHRVVHTYDPSTSLFP